MTSDLQVLSRLRERLASMQVLSCRLAHEQVVMQDGVARRRAQGIDMEPAYIRIGLCPIALRSRQLSCAHTLARYSLERTIDALEREAVLDAEDAGRLRNDVRRISHAIHLTDWSKNESEVRYAVLAEQATATEKPGSALILEEKTRLTELVGQHEAAVEELRGMRAFLLEKMDDALCGLSDAAAGIGADGGNENAHKALPALDA